MKPLPLVVLVRSATTAFELCALTPYQLPPGTNSSCVVKGTMIAAEAVVRVRRMGTRRTPMGSSVVRASCCMNEATSATHDCLRMTVSARLTFWSRSSRVCPDTPMTMTC